jgi:type IV secretion system protein TrbL
MEPGILDTILDEFQGALNVAIPFLQGDVGFLFQVFLVITIALAGAAYALGDNSAGLHLLLKKVLLIGFTLFLIQNWLFLTNAIVNSFGILGLRAGGIAGVTLTTADFFFPSRIVDLGFGIAEQIFDQINVAGSLFGFNLGDLAVALLAGITMGLAFIIIALQVFMALIEFKLVTLGGFILLPFALLERTSSLAERALGYVIAAGLKIFALAVVVSFAFAILPNLELSEELTLSEAFTVIGTALTFLMLSIKAPALATSLVSGGPSLGLGAVTQTATTVIGTSAAAWYAVASAGRTAMAGGRAVTGGRSSGATTRTNAVGSSTRATPTPAAGSAASPSASGSASIRQNGSRAADATRTTVPRDRDSQDDAASNKETRS